MQNAAAVNARPRLTRSKALTSLIRWSLTALICFIILLPLWWIFISSITPTSELYQSPIRYLPAHPTFENYLRAVNDMGIASKVKNTLLITACALGGSILLGLMAAYAFARFDRKGIKIAYLALLFSSLIPGHRHRAHRLRLFQNHAVDRHLSGADHPVHQRADPFSVLILMNFVQQVPYSIEEAAEVDGANFLQKLFLIILPLMSPAIATIAIINFITCLNDLFTPLFFANRIDVLSVGITTVPRKNTYDVPWDMISTIGCIIILPIIVFVLCFERKIMEGIMAGGVKQ